MSDVFTNDSIKDLSFVIKTSIVYILLILVVVVLFLNLWIANTVNDIEVCEVQLKIKYSNFVTKSVIM